MNKAQVAIQMNTGYLVPAPDSTHRARSYIAGIDAMEAIESKAQSKGITGNITAFFFDDHSRVVVEGGRVFKVEAEL